jgi:LCP family protein required for cell wall assembly
VELKDAAGTVPAGSMDKLTHASNFGVDSAIKTLNNLYQIDISHYIRVNFTGFESIVDAIGGITIDSPYSFTSVDGFYYPQGVQDMNGKQALNYARERKAFTDGDLQRNKNQTQVLQAILNKVLSPSILTSYGSLMDSVPNAFLTSLTKDDISSLVKLQQSSNIDWDILSYNVLGTTGNEYVYSISSFPVSVVYLDETNVANATSLMQRMLNGERITQTEIDALSSNTQ